MDWARRHRTAWHVGIGEHKENWNKTLEDMMVVERDRNGRKKLGRFGTERKGLVAGAGTDTAGPPKLASQHY